MANAPRAETVASVSCSAAVGHPVPFARQTAWPMTVAVAKVALVANRLVPDAVEKPSQLVLVPFVNVSAVGLKFETLRLVKVALLPVMSVTLNAPVLVPPLN